MLVVRYRRPIRRRCAPAIERVWQRHRPRRAVRGRVQPTTSSPSSTTPTRRAATIFAGFALLAVVIACLGLFGLAAFTAERRTKEIGIRKVLGARTRDIVRLLVWQFSKPVIDRQPDRLAGRLVGDARLAERLRRADRPRRRRRSSLAGLLALAIAIGTIAGHAIRVARANPIHALRYE